MLRQSPIVLILLVFCTSFLFAGLARAEFTVCNRTIDVVNVSIGVQVRSSSGQAGEFETQGWWTIGSNQCADVIREPLSSRFVYVYAHDVFGQPLLNGTVRMCIDRKRFTIRGTDECWQKGYQAAQFIEVDTQAVERWTLFLAD